MPWRTRLLVAIAAVFLIGEAWMFWSATPALRTSLSVLTWVYLAAMGGVFTYYRHRITPNLLTANVGLGALVHLALTGLVVTMDRLTALGFFPALAQNWHHFLLGALGIIAAFLSWTQARGHKEGEVSPEPLAHQEPAPPATPFELEPWSWEAIDARLSDDPRRRREVARLRRVADVLTDEDDEQTKRIAAAIRITRQEAQRILNDATAAAKEDDDVLSQTANLLEWGAQKLPELAELDVSDLMMGKAIADIRARHDHIEQRFVDHRNLLPIHPIDRDTANDKCNERAAAARKALPLLRANGMRLSEELIAAQDELAPFRSVTGFQVFELSDGGFVTFEGNGRREALQRAFGTDEPIFVEVKNYVFDDPDLRDKMERRVRRVRKWKNIEK